MTARTPLFAFTFLLSASAFAQSAPITQFEQRGSGPTNVVLLAGLSSDWTMWSEFMDRNGSNYTMYAVTLPGFSGTQAPSPQPDQATPWIDNALSAVQQFIAANAIENPVIVGHGLGGVVATRLGVERGEAARAVINVDGLLAYPRPDGSTIEAHRASVAQYLEPMFQTMTEEQWQQQQAATAKVMAKEPQSTDELSRMFARTTKDVGVSYLLEAYKLDATQGLATLTLPTLVITAGEPQALGGIPANKVASWWDTTLTGAAPTVQRHTIPDARHFVMYDQPEAFDQAVLAFISGLSTTPAGTTANAVNGVIAQD